MLRVFALFYRKRIVFPDAAAESITIPAGDYCMWASAIIPTVLPFPFSGRPVASLPRETACSVLTQIEGETDLDRALAVCWPDGTEPQLGWAGLAGLGWARLGWAGLGDPLKPGLPWPVVSHLSLRFD